MKFCQAAAFCILCLWTTLSNGQKGSLLFHQLKSENGLGELTNSYSYKDSRGFIWINSINGLHRFDGVNVKSYNWDPQDPNSLFGQIVERNFIEDKSGYMWLCTYGGLNVYDPRQDTFGHFILRDSLGDPIQGYQIFYKDSLDHLWTVIGGKYLYTFNINTRTFSFIAPLTITSGRASVINPLGGYPKQIITFFPSRPGIEFIEINSDYSIARQFLLKDIQHGETITPREIVHEGDSVLWIAEQAGLIKYQLDSHKIQFYPLPGILTVEIYNDSTLLVSARDAGVWEFDKRTSGFVYLYSPEAGNPASILTNRVRFISTDKDGGIWMFSYENGISYAYPGKNKFTTSKFISPEYGTNLTMNSIFEDETGVFCATENSGLYALDQNARALQKIKQTDPVAEKRMNSVYAMFQDTRSIKWLCSYFGTSVIPPGSNQMIHITDDTTNFYLPFELSDGSIILGKHHGGLFKYTSDGNNYVIRRIDSIDATKEYFPIGQDRQGGIWVSEQLQKIIIVDQHSLVKVGEIPIIGFVASMINNDDGMAWVATSTGLYKVNTDEHKIIETFNGKNSLSCDGISNMLMDESGKLWLSCKNQLMVFDPLTEMTKIFNHYDGLPLTPFTSPGAYRFKSGEMWFSSPGRIVSFHPSKVERLAIQAIPQITNLLINDHPSINGLQCEKTGARNIVAIEKLTFTHLENTLSFLVNSLEYSAPPSNMVKYILEGVDKGWLEIKSGSMVRYPNLRAGTFLFKVQAANSDGVYNDDIRELMITITPPFYKTWWFITLSALALLGLIIYIMYLNFSKKLELQKVRLRLYENLHDEVGSRLTSIVFMAEEVAQHNGQNPKLQQISKVAKSIVANMRRLVWATDPENDTMQSLVQKIRLDKSMILDDKIDFHLDLDPKLSDMNLQGEIRYQITSVINEALNNISKYAEAKNVFILIGMKDNDLHLRIRDDGLGFSPEETKIDKVKSSGYGLGNMNRRIARVKGTLTINSQPGKGTTIDAMIPLA